MKSMKQHLKLTFLAVLASLFLSGCLSTPPLNKAAADGNIEEVKARIAAGDGLERINSLGFTPLMEAVIKGHQEVVTLLVESGANVNAMSEFGGPVHFAVMSGNLSILEYLLSKNADINGGTLNTGNTPLITCGLSGSLETAQYLIEHGADMHKTNNNGNTALDAAFYMQEQNKDRTEVIAYFESIGIECTEK